jgi:hypothetical protein
MEIFIEKIEKLNTKQLFKALQSIAPLSNDTVNFGERLDQLALGNPLIDAYIMNLREAGIIVANEYIVNGIFILRWFLENRLDKLLLYPHRVSSADCHNGINMTGLHVEIVSEPKSHTSVEVIGLVRALQSQSKVEYYVNTVDIAVKTQKLIPLSEGGNALILIGENRPHSHSHHQEHVDDQMTLLQTNIDDMNPEIIPYVLEQLLENGANDAFSQPILMKKGRHAIMLNVLCANHKIDQMEEIIFQETSTIGIRRLPAAVHRLGRTIETLETKFGTVSVKVAKYLGKIKQVTPEFEDCKALARQNNVPLKEVYEAVNVEIARKYSS